MNQRICITGVSRGLGLRLAKDALESGARVIGVSRTQTPECLVLQEEFGERFEHIALDLGQAAERTAALKRLMPLNRPTDVLILNAALAVDGLATDLPLEDVQQMFEVNVFAGMELGRQFIRNRLAHGGGGQIITISSVAAHEGFTGLSAYAASKAALEAWTRTIGREWKRKSIRANAVVAGFMDTAMTASLSDAQRDRIFERSPSGAPVSLQAVTDKVRWLLDQDSDGPSGQSYRIE
ncbi:MAG: SDR family oxidoreductase [Opitutales bacterium]|nr:SDR family oxidoreductase [Opitutales bacterium]